MSDNLVYKELDTDTIFNYVPLPSELTIELHDVWYAKTVTFPLQFDSSTPQRLPLVQ